MENEIIMVSTEDRTCLERCRKGDHEEFEGVVRSHQKMIYSLCYRMTGSIACAEDLVQETFVRAFHHLDSFKGESRISSWLYRIAMNICLNWRQQEARQIRIMQAYADQLGAETQSSEQGKPDVQAALLKLPAPQRAAVILTIYEDLSHAEAARVLGCSETTVSWRVFAAKRRLKALLKRMKGQEVV